MAECCAFPVPDKAFGEEIGIALVLSPDVSEEAARAAIAAECAAKLASYKIPKHMFFMESFPKNSGGKVVKPEVIKSALSHL